MKTQIIGNALGLFCGVIIVIIVQFVGHQIYQVPESLDYTNQKQMAEYIATLPITAFLFVLFSWILGALGSVFTATAIIKNSKIPQRVIGSFFAVAVTSNLWMIPHPTWFVVVTVLLLPLSIFLGAYAGGGPGER